MIDYGRLRQAQQYFAASLTLEQVADFAGILVDPASARSRIVEELQPLKRAIRQRVSTNIQLSSVSSPPVAPPATGLSSPPAPASTPGGTPPAGQGPQFALYPIIVPRKGELQDDLNVSVSGLDTVSTLNYYEYLVLVARLLTTLSQAAISTAEPGDKVKLAAREQEAFNFISRRGRLNPTEEAACAACHQELLEIASRLSVASHADEAGFVKLMAALLEKLAGSYVIVAVIPLDEDRPGRFVVTYERYLIPNLKLASASKPHLWLRDRFRILLGTRPVYLDIPLSNAAAARSFHLHVLGPDGMFVGWQELTGPTDIFTSSGTPRDELSPYKRFRKRLGQRYLHVYLRSVPQSVADSLRLNVRFYEVPPGSIGRAAMAAASCFALVYLAGLVISSTGKTFGSDFPALVLAFPAVAAILSGFEVRATQLIDGTSAARGSLLLTIGVSLAASGLYMAETAGKLLDAGGTDDGFRLLGVSQTWWQPVVAVALLNSIYSTYVWASRSASYLWLASREIRDTRVLEGGP